MCKKLVGLDTAFHFSEHASTTNTASFLSKLDADLADMAVAGSLEASIASDDSLSAVEAVDQFLTSLQPDEVADGFRGLLVI